MKNETFLNHFKKWLKENDQVSQRSMEYRKLKTTTTKVNGRGSNLTPPPPSLALLRMVDGRGQPYTIDYNNNGRLRASVHRYYKNHVFLSKTMSSLLKGPALIKKKWGNNYRTTLLVKQILKPTILPKTDETWNHSKCSNTTSVAPSMRRRSQG